ncbi:MAG: hypothetical protein LBD22_05255 [Spirochaetaceae bacterium]|nr:hypothetical protein [Spirochaetaceae bacterium]
MVDIIQFVQEFGAFRNTALPTPGEIGRALWDSAYLHDELTGLYNLFAWYALEEVSNIWYRYLEDNRARHAELLA